jgi:lysozyme
MTLDEQLLRDEGEILHAYQDSEGWWTIGVGHLIDVRKGGSIPREISRALLAYDLARVQEGLFQALPWAQTLTPPRQAVLVGMAFNMGVAGLLDFKRTLEFVRQGDFDRAAAEMLDSHWAVQVGNRAHRLSEQMRTGEWM